MPNFLAFFSFVIVTLYTPGPNTIMAMSNASRYGFKKSMEFNLGVLCGIIVIMNLCSIFSLTVYRLIPSVKPVMTAVGAAYIFWLAWRTYQSKPRLEGEEENEGKDTNTFLPGLILQFVNPKLILFGITVISSFILPYYNSPLLLMFFSVFLAFMGFGALICWSLFGSLFQRTYQKNYRPINTVMALLLVYCAIALFL